MSGPPSAEIIVVGEGLLHLNTPTSSVDAEVTVKVIRIIGLIIRSVVGNCGNQTI